MLDLQCSDQTPRPSPATAHHPVDNARTATRAPSRASGFVLRRIGDRRRAQWMVRSPPVADPRRSPGWLAGCSGRCNPCDGRPGYRRSFSGSSSPPSLITASDCRAVRRAIEPVGQPGALKVLEPRPAVREGVLALRGAAGVRCTFGLRVSSPCRVPHRARSRVPFSVIWPRVIWGRPPATPLLLALFQCIRWWVQQDSKLRPAD